VGSIDFGDPLVLGATVLVALGLLLIALIVRKGRPFAQGDVFRASRLSSGNRVFPTQVRITPDAVIRHTPRWFGHLEQSIHLAHVSSVRVETRLLFSDVFIETSGGTNAVACHGHRKADAMVMKQLIERYQTAYFRQPPPPPRLSNSPGPADKMGGPS
jgi:hypothetical protein